MVLPYSQALPHHVSGSEWETFSLLKFSFALSPLGATSHKWVHDGRSDELFLVFQSTRLSFGETENASKETGGSLSLTMSVLAGTETLERQDLGRLSSIVREFDDRVQMGLVDHSVEVPVQIVVKSPCIAFRYPVSPSSVRRTQMRFKNDSDYYRSLDIFRRLNFSIRLSGKGDSTNPEQVSKPTAIIVPPPLRLSSSVTSPELSTIFGVSKTPNLIPRSLSALDSVFKRPQTSSTEIVPPESVFSVGTATETSPSSSVSRQPSVKQTSLKNFRLPNSSNPISQLEGETGLPASTMVVQGRREERTPMFSYNPLSQRRDQSQVPGKNRASDIHPFPISQAPPYFTSASVGLADAAGLKRAFSVFDTTPTPVYDFVTQMERHNSSVPGSLRPMSAPVAETQNISQWVPPRRELPFPKTREKPRPASTGLPLPSQPALVTREVIATEGMQTGNRNHPTPAQSRICNRTGEQHVRSESTRLLGRSRVAAESNMEGGQRTGESLAMASYIDGQPSLAAKNIQSSTTLGLQSMGMASSKRTRETSTVETMSENKQAKMVDHSTQTQTLSGRDHTAPLTLMSGNERLVSTVTEETLPQPPQPPEAFMNGIDEFVSKYKNRPAPQEIWLSPGYSETSPEERQSIINDFICENLDNEDFIKLCEDTADVWRRIGLGD